MNTLYNQNQPPKTGNGNTRLIPETLKQASGKDFKTLPESNKRKNVHGDTKYFPGFIVHLDYLRIKGKLPVDKFEQMMTYLCGSDWVVEMEKPWAAGTKATWFPHKLMGIGLLVGGFRAVDGEQNVEFMLDMPGTYWKGKSLVNTWRLLRGLKSAYQVSSTRIDIAIDDKTYKHIPWEEMDKACEDGNNFYFRKSPTNEDWLIGVSRDKTRYYGSRESSKYARVYNHKNECLRFETAFNRERAPVVFDALASLERGECAKDEVINTDVIVRKNKNCPGQSWTHKKEGEITDEKWEQSLAKTFGAFAVGVIDFRDRSSRENVKKASSKDTKRLPFWETFIKKIGFCIRVRLPKVIPTIEKNVEWLKRQVATSLAVLKDGLGSINFTAAMRELIDSGRERMKSRHDLLAKEVKKKQKEVIEMFKDSRNRKDERPSPNSEFIAKVFPSELFEKDPIVFSSSG